MVTKGNNNQQRDADFHILCIPTSELRSVVNRRFAPLASRYGCPRIAPRKTLREPLYISNKIQNNVNVRQGAGFRTKEPTAVHRVHGYFVHPVLFSFALTASAADSASINQQQWV